MSDNTPDWHLIKNISQEMQSESPVFIVGFNRSGTSVLKTTLSLHQSFHSSLKRSPETRVFTHPQNILQAAEGDKNNAYKFIIKTNEDLLEFQKIIGAPEAWKQENLIELLRTYFYFAKQKRRCKRLLEKSPNHIQNLDLIFKCFPKAQVIMNCRHPLDVYSSLRKRREKNQAKGLPPATKGWQYLKPQQFSDKYISILKNIAKMRDDSRCHFQEYEQLSNEPRQSLTSIGKFLNESFHLDEICPDESKATDQHDISDQQFITHNPKKWSDYLSKEEASTVEDLIEEHYPLVGYQRYT